ncbi:MAG: OmpH family outer membrane protein [Planctomycetes bacterium]|nr:OmpH family outer membrane protein [Planctomycetota bacterium]
MTISPRRSIFWSPTFAALVLGGCFVMGMTLPTGAKSAAPQPTRVGLVDTRRLLKGLDEAKARNETIATRRKSMSDKLAEIDTQIKEIDTQLQVIPKDDTAKRTDLMAKRYELGSTREARAKAFEQVFSLEIGGLLTDVYKHVQAACEELAKRDGYDLVLVDDRAIQLPENGNDREVTEIIQNKRIMAAQGGIDATEALLTMMNNQYAAGLKKP